MNIILFQSNTASPQPSPTAQVKNVVDAFKDFLNGVSAAEVSWMIAGILMVGILYWLSIQQLRRKKTDWRTVLFWFSWIALWGVLMVIFGYLRITEGGSLPVLLALGTALVSLTAVFLVSQKSNQWQRIFSGMIIIIIGSAIIITIAKGAHAYSYALMFGCLFGIEFGMFLISTLRITGTLQMPVDEHNDFDTLRQRPKNM